MFELINKRTKKVVNAKSTMNIVKGGYDIVHENGKVEFLTVTEYNKKYSTRLKKEVLQEVTSELAKEPKQETIKEAKKKKEVKPKKETKKVKEDNEECPSKTLEDTSKTLEPNKRVIPPLPIIEDVKKAFKEFEGKDENITQDVKTKVTNFKYKGRVLVEIHYQKRKVKCLFNEKGLSEKNLNLCTMVNPNFKWSTNAEYNIQTESQIKIAMDMLQEAYEHRKNAFATRKEKKVK